MKQFFLYISVFIYLMSVAACSGAKFKVKWVGEWKEELNGRTNGGEQEDGDDGGHGEIVTKFEEEDVANCQTDIVCPDNYVAVPICSGINDDVGVSADFCIAKYEMKLVGTDDGTQTAYDDLVDPEPESRASGSPWTQITRDQAIDECQSLGGDYDLISNAQWQAVARNIEAVRENWSGDPSLTDTMMNRGHTDVFGGHEFHYLPASSDDDLGCFQIGANTWNGEETSDDCNSAWHLNKRTLMLTTSEVIWDLPGNATEWIKDDNNTYHGADDQEPFDGAPEYSSGSIEKDPYNFAPAANKLKWGPKGAYSAKSCPGTGCGFGYFTDGAAGAISRGGGTGHSVFNTKIGLFAVTLTNTSSVSYVTGGFRCVYHP